MSKTAFALACVILAISSGAEARQLLQGTNSTNNVVERWLVPENGVLEAIRIPVGGSVTFTWTARHDLWEIPSAQCPSTFANSSTITQLAPQATGGSHTVEFPEEKVRYFACSVSDHCEEGQLVAVRVGNARAASSPGGSPAAAPRRSSGYGGGGSSEGYGGNSSPGYGGGSSSNYGGSAQAPEEEEESGSGYGGNSSPGYGGGSSSNYAGSGK